MRKGSIFASIVGLGLVLAACSSGPSPAAHLAAGRNPAVAAGSEPDATVEFRQAMRKLWEDHITWTRLYIVSAVAELPDLKVTTDRLLRNQDDIGNAIEPYYGEAAGDKLTKLLREHILVAADLLGAAKAGDDAKLERSKNAWYDNADQIASFLAKANPENWPKDAVSAHMRMHLDLTLEEAVARLTNMFPEDVAAYDKIHDGILELADALSAGIIAQFPDKF